MADPFARFAPSILCQVVSSAALYARLLSGAVVTMVEVVLATLTVEVLLIHVLAHLLLTKQTFLAESGPIVIAQECARVEFVCAVNAFVFEHGVYLHAT